MSASSHVDCRSEVYAFSLDPDLSKELKEGPVGKRLGAAFEDKGMPLPRKARIHTVYDGEWQISTGVDVVCIVNASGRRLRVLFRSDYYSSHYDSVGMGTGVAIGAAVGFVLGVVLALAVGIALVGSLVSVIGILLGMVHGSIVGKALGRRKDRRVIASLTQRQGTRQQSTRGGIPSTK